MASRRSALLLSLVCAAAPALLAQVPAGALQGYSETIPGSVVSFDMIPVPGGTVTVQGKTVQVKPFYIGKTEATWDMYDVYALGLDKGKETGGSDAVARPSQPYAAPDYGWGHTGYPVISVTRAAAQTFAGWLSKKTGKTYRLPTEAEWLRAAELAKFESSKADALAWHQGNAGSRTHAVATKKPDALGLFDVFGNAAEWVTTDDDSLVTRGGSFRDPASGTARALQDDSWNERDPQLPKSRWWLSDGPFVGFRLVRQP
jgi:formylglycine-generating enzyme required for sulfatase activity